MGCWRPLTDRELAYRELVRKRAVAARPVGKGEVLTAADIVYKRSNEGAYPAEVTILLGRRAKEDVGVDSPITEARFG